MFCFRAVEVFITTGGLETHILDQKHHFELFHNVNVPEKQKMSEWVHILVKIQAQNLTLSSFTSIF